jgi:hypothetical protein
MLFVDGHAANFVLKTYNKPMKEQPTFNAKSWESEFIKNNEPWYNIDGRKSMQELALTGLSRNPDMPLVWSIPGKLYRP